MARQLSTSNYTDDERQRLAEAVLEAREAAGHSQPSLARAAGISPRSISLVENAEPGVGPKVLRAIGRTLPNWTPETAQQILEGGPIPSNASAGVAPTAPAEAESAEKPESVQDPSVREQLEEVERELAELAAEERRLAEEERRLAERREQALKRAAHLLGQSSEHPKGKRRAG